MPTLVIGNMKAVGDEEAMARYRAEVLATIEAYGGRFAIRGGHVDVLEGDWHPEHLSIMEFPSLSTFGVLVDQAAASAQAAWTVRISWWVGWWGFVARNRAAIRTRRSLMIMSW
jgi:uncharacterized protein (DUF1330 family)